MRGLISVIIPCHNGTNYLAEAVAGIRKQNVPLEIIVVDDVSTDDTAALAKNLDCRVIRHETRRGTAAGKNTGLTEARGNYILFHDHDDVLNEGALQRLYNEIEEDNAIQIVEAGLVDFISPELDEAEKKTLSPRPAPYYGLLTGTVLFRRQVFELAGDFNETLMAGECIDFMLRVKSKGIKIKRIDFVSARRRLHNANMGRTMQKQENKDYASLLRAKMRGCCS